MTPLDDAVPANRSGRARLRRAGRVSSEMIAGFLDSNRHIISGSLPERAFLARHDREFPRLLLASDGLPEAVELEAFRRATEAVDMLYRAAFCEEVMTPSDAAREEG
jgi:hypothetical protein